MYTFYILFRPQWEPFSGVQNLNRPVVTSSACSTAPRSPEDRPLLSPTMWSWWPPSPLQCRETVWRTLHRKSSYTWRRSGARSVDSSFYFFAWHLPETCDPLQAPAWRTLPSFVQQREALRCLARDDVNDIYELVISSKTGCYTLASFI